VTLQKIRDFRWPDAAWLSSFQKIQLAHLIAELRGAGYAPPPERKKSELVEELAQLFTDAAEHNLDDKQLSEAAHRLDAAPVPTNTNSVTWQGPDSKR
jgi:hypothetical protein